MLNVLIIDDRDDVRSILREMLQSLGCGVVEARNGKEAIELYRAAPTRIVITDIYMPVMDGLEVIMSLRADYPEVKIIAMSGDSSSGLEDCLEMAQGLGADMTITKPFSTKQIFESLQSLDLLPSETKKIAGQFFSR